MHTCLEPFQGRPIYVGIKVSVYAARYTTLLALIIIVARLMVRRYCMRWILTQRKTYIKHPSPITLVQLSVPKHRSIHCKEDRTITQLFNVFDYLF